MKRGGGLFFLIKNKRVLLPLFDYSGLGSIRNGVSGFVEEGESVEIAFIREIKEETGLEILEAEPFDIKIIEDQWQVKYCVFFKCEVEDVDNLKISDEHGDHVWASREDINELDTEDEPSVREVLNKYLTQLSTTYQVEM